MFDNAKAFAKKNYDDVIETLRALCRLPSPSHFENERAEFCKGFLLAHGAKGVYIDDALNVIFPLGCEGSDEITVLAAHTDTVFPDREPMKMTEDEDRIYCPGVWDDTTGVAVILYTAVYFLENNIIPPKGIMFVCNSCEEGLGNLKGTKALISAYGDRIARFISFDSIGASIVNKAVGSCRFEVEVKTNGGHSFSDFGNRNAIAVLSDMISKIYAIEVPEIEGTKTTYNVGTIEGGTSVNTIAQNAKMLCEYRSDDRACLETMRRSFMDIFTASYDAEIEVRIVGERPCGGDVDGEKQAELERVCEKYITEVFENAPARESGSTDCNIPLSVGIPSVCIGVSMGQGAHTREEWVDKKSINLGLEMSIKLLAEIAGTENLKAD